MKGPTTSRPDSPAGQTASTSGGVAHACAVRMPCTTSGRPISNTTSDGRPSKLPVVLPYPAGLPARSQISYNRSQYESKEAFR